MLGGWRLAPHLAHGALLTFATGVAATSGGLALDGWSGLHVLTTGFLLLVLGAAGAIASLILAGTFGEALPRPTLLAGATLALLGLGYTGALLAAGTTGEPALRLTLLTTLAFAGAGLAAAPRVWRAARPSADAATPAPPGA